MQYIDLSSQRGSAGPAARRRNVFCFHSCFDLLQSAAMRVVATRQRRTTHETFVNGRRCAGGSEPGASRGIRAGWQSDHRGGHRQHRWHPARRHRRGVQPGADRGQPRRDQRRGGSLHHRRPAPGHVHRDLHVARLLGRRGRGPGPSGGLRGDGRRRAFGRRSRRDGHRLRRGPGRGRGDHPPRRGARPRGARRHSDRQQPAIDRAVDSGHQVEPAGGRPDDRGAADLHVGPRHERPPDHGRRRRPARHELRVRRGEPELQQPPREPGDGLRDERHLGRDFGRRRADQHDRP